MDPRTRHRRTRRTGKVLALAVALVGAGLVAAATPATGEENLPALVPGLATVIEGNSGTTTVEVPVTLSEPTAETVTADWQTIFGPGIEPPNPATPGDDFTAASGTVTFAPGDTTETVTIEVQGDTAIEPDEYVVVAFTNITNARPGGYFALGFAVIEDDDTPPTIVPGVANVLEGNTGGRLVEVPVTLSAPFGAPVTANWATIFGPGIEPPNPATPGDDFTAASGTVTFAPGDTTKTVTIEVQGDTAIEPDEYVVVAFTNPQNAALGGFFGLGFAVIEDDDTPPAISPGRAAVFEGDEGTTVLSVPVTLSAPFGGTVSVDWATFSAGLGPGGPPEAEPGIDYDPASGTLIFEPNQTLATMDITIYGDTDFEPDETILIQLSAPINGSLSANQFERLGFGTVRNDDPQPSTRTLSLVPSPPVDGGDTVTVVGSGWTPGAEIGYCQAVDDPSLITSPGAGCFAGTGSPSFTVADQDGNFSAPLPIYRWGYVGTLDLMLDCTQPVPGCIVGAAELDDLIPTTTVTPLPFSTPPPPPSTRGEVTVMPSTDLTDGQSVTITGSGFRPNQVIDLNQCIVVPVFTGPSGCEWGTRARTTSDDSGNVSATFTVFRQIQGIDCTTRTCYLVASEAVDFVGTYVASPIAFAPPP